MPKQKPLELPSEKPIPLPKKRQRIVQAAFLDAFRRAGTIGAAATEVGITRDTVKKWRKAKDFEARFQDADEDITEMLERSAMQKAIAPTGMIMNIFLLKARRPFKYGDRVKHEHQGGVTIADFLTGATSAKPRDAGSISPMDQGFPGPLGGKNLRGADLGQADGNPPEHHA